ncbi:aminopeptidase N-like [Camponotus floridanus]|uniref:aminopeptidase N-like n=1 Tax=Camponotus floridanus TaxID=104421 RepID=UPI000DC6CB19|nr:aminopeptidase N-like [Camponotus floridanus]
MFESDLIDMAILKLLINLGLIFIAKAIFPIDKASNNDMVSVDKDSNNNSAINYRLPDNVVPIHYNIKLMPYIEENNFVFIGESNINITIRHVTQNLSLHTLKLIINEAVISLFDNNGTVYTLATHNYDNITQILVLNFNDKLLPGNYTLKMRYVGILHKDLKGFFISSYINEKGNNVWLAATYFEPTYARRAFPCWDEPALKATFDISIKHHRNYTALSNMPIREQSEDYDEDGMIWTHFDTTPIMSTYLVAFVLVADYVRVPTKDETINIWCRSKLVPDTKFAQEVVQKSKRLLTEYTNSTYKVPKMDLVALPEYKSSAMENWGLNIFAERYLAYNESFDTISMKLYVAVAIIHEIAHQWFGNIVTPLWWSDVWLKEGFASFFQVYIFNQIFEDWRIMEFFVIDIERKILYSDIGMFMNPITLEVNRPIEIESLFSYPIYGKAPAILRMLQHIITDEIFQSGLIKYLHTHQFNSTTSDDLWNALQAVLDKSDVPHNAYRLKEVMDTWIKQSDFPVVHVTRNSDNNKQMGYYRVNYDSSNWQKIVNYLKSDNYTKIHALNRAQIIDDAYIFLMMSRNDITMFLNLIDYLSQETDVIPWLSMFKILGNTQDIYKVPENDFLKLYILKILDGLIKNIGYEEDPAEDNLKKLQRTEALKWACTLGHSECKRMATVKLNEHFADPKTYKVPPNLKEWVYCNGLMEANVFTWNKLFDIYINETDEEALMYLVCSENPDIIINLLKISISNNSIIQIEDYYVIYSFIIEKHAKNNVVIDYILTNLEKIISRNVNNAYHVNNIYYLSSALNYIIDNVYSKGKLDQL